MSTHVQEIKDKLDIAAVVGSYIKLDKVGANFKARCPFHNEKTPSFFVSPERGSFYCFGCQAKGDIFTFVEKFEGLDFMGSLKVLAERAGVRLDRDAAPKDNRKEILYDILEKAAAWFEERLVAEPHAKEYALGRGLTQKTIDSFRIGYAPNDWRQLRSYLKGKGYKDEDVAAVGLIKKTDKPGGDPFYDVFRGRIMFPIADSSGRAVAFSGRIVVDDGKSPKYLNSPETALYSKSKTLYGLDKAKTAIRERGYSIVVEGQMDLVMSHQGGFANTVASSGTAFTDDDGADSAFGLLTRLSDNIVLAFDSDSAGQKAVKRIVPAISLGMNVKIVDIKGGKDPADIIKANPKDWTTMLGSKKDFIDYLTDIIIDSKANAASVAKQVKTDIFPYIAAIPDDTPRFQAVKKVADRLSISEDALWKDLQNYVKANRSARASPGQSASGQSPGRRLERLESIERKLLGLLHSKKYWNGDEVRRRELESAAGDEKARAFASLSPDDMAELTLEAEVTYGDGDTAREWKVLMLNFEEEATKKKLEAAMAELHRKEKEKGDASELIKNIHVLSKRIQEVKGQAEKM
ncbi:MAG TPA: DNA primase [Candidatus Paceibacterota bacterium]|nr:DNA primase [Candidatus Paceibacterota bacterium]